jgi:hypothetical protein
MTKVWADLFMVTIADEFFEARDAIFHRHIILLKRSLLSAVD